MSTDVTGTRVVSEHMRLTCQGLRTMPFPCCQPCFSQNGAGYSNGIGIAPRSNGSAAACLGRSGGAAGPTNRSATGCGRRIATDRPRPQDRALPHKNHRSATSAFRAERRARPLALLKAPPLPSGARGLWLRPSGSMHNGPVSATRRRRSVIFVRGGRFCGNLLGPAGRRSRAGKPIRNRRASLRS